MFAATVKNKKWGILAIALCVMVMGFLFAPQVSHAETIPSASVGSQAATAQADAITAPSANNTCGGGIICSFALGALIKLITVPLYIIEMLVAGLLGLVGLFLDAMIQLSTVNLATNLAALTGINTTWQLIRDLCNMSFIFILVYNGIMIMFGKGNKKIIVSVIIAAVLINFSLFFTKVVIDASNVVATSFYNSIIKSPAVGQAQTVGVGTNAGTTGQTSTTVTFGLSGALMAPLNLTSLYGADTLSGSFAAVGSNPGPYVLSVVGGTLLMLVAMFVFLAMGVFFAVRYIAFIFLLIVSPVGFMASVIPGLSSISKKFWDTLLGQAIFAPLFMIMMYIIMVVISTGNFLGTAQTCTTSGANNPCSMGAILAQPSASSMGLLINYVIVIGLLIGAIILSKSFATKGGVASGALVTKVTGFAGNTLFGGSAAIGRNTFGRFADRTSKSQWLQDKASGRTSANFVTRKLYSGVLSGSGKAATSSFDARNTATGKTAGASLGKVVGGSVGQAGGQGGFAKAKTEKVTAINEKAKRFTNRAARAAYAERRARGVFTRGGSTPNNVNSLFGMLGAHNRIAAATLINERVTELRGNAGTFRSELNGYMNTMGLTGPGIPGPAPTVAELRPGGVHHAAATAVIGRLGAFEQQRFNNLIAATVRDPASGRVTNDSIEAVNDELADTRNLINNAPAAGGLGLQNTIRQGF